MRSDSGSLWFQRGGRFSTHLINFCMNFCISSSDSFFSSSLSLSLLLRALSNLEEVDEDFELSGAIKSKITPITHYTLMINNMYKYVLAYYWIEQLTYLLYTCGWGLSTSQTVGMYCTTFPKEKLINTFNDIKVPRTQIFN